MIIDFKAYSSVRIGPVLDVFVIDEYCDFQGLVIGKANNLLVNKAKTKLAILGKNFDFIEILDKNENFMLFKAGCACSNTTLYNFAKKHNLSGFEFLNKIPGLLGGLLKMNAGLKNEQISQNLVSIFCSNQEIAKENINFSYRTNPLQGIFYWAIFKLFYGFDYQKDEELKQARKNQPKGPSFGSIFKNPKQNFAAKLIEEVGLKGFRRNDALISKTHANFLINTKNASFDDAMFLINLAQEKVFKEFNISLEHEVVILT